MFGLCHEVNRQTLVNTQTKPPLPMYSNFLFISAGKLTHTATVKQGRQIRTRGNFTDIRFISMSMILLLKCQF